MEELKNIIRQMVDKLKDSLSEFYEIYESYLVDLIHSKNIDVSVPIDMSNEEHTKTNILSIIAVVNSALITIGLEKTDLTPDRSLFQDLFRKNIGSFADYKSFLQLGLKNYIDKHLFIVILDYVINKNTKIVDNLDLFDLLPHEFRNKLTEFRSEINATEDLKAKLKIFTKNLLKYFNPSELTFMVDNFQIEDNHESISEEDILRKLQEARQNNLEAINHPINHSSNKSSSGILLGKENNPSFLDFFFKFPKLDQSITSKLIINRKALKKLIRTSPEFLDLENLYYLINIFKMLGEELQLESGYIRNIINNYVSGNVFSTGRYHKPNPITIYHGLSVLSGLDLMNTTEFVDLLDVEMVLENELNPFFPSKLILNFFTLLSLKLLKKSGGIITNKSHLMEPLSNLDIFNLENFKPSSDIFFYLSSLKLLDNRIDFKNIQTSYLIELKKQIHPDGSVNGNTTDTARTLLTLALLDSTGKETSLIPELLGFLSHNVNFFSDSQDFTNFNWQQNKIAFKIELRMLFWMLLALSQYF
ncbi:MAG: hypothetical protein ACFE96_07635 [Candidatus Hermodarchaeota archaeon]